MCKVAPLSKSAGPFSEILTELGLEVVCRSWGRRRMVPHGRSRGCTNICNELLNHGTGLIDLIESTLKLNVPPGGIWIMLFYGKLCSCHTANMLWVHTILPNDGSSKWSIYKYLSSGRGSEASHSPMTGLVMIGWVRFNPATHPAWHWSHCPRIFIGWSSWLAKFPLTMSKMAFISKLASFGWLKLVAQTGLDSWRRWTIWKWWWSSRISSRLWKSWVASNIHHLRHNFDATRNIVQEVTCLTKWAPRSAALQKKIECHLSKTKYNIYTLRGYCNYKHTLIRKQKLLAQTRNEQNNLRIPNIERILQFCIGLECLEILQNLM